MSTLEKHPQGINMNQLPELMKANPRYTRMLTGLREIDAFIKKVVEETVANHADPSIYHIKTELHDMTMYSIQLFNSERQAIVGHAWILTDLLAECQAKVISSDVENTTKRMLSKFGEANLTPGEEIHWL